MAQEPSSALNGKLALLGQMYADGDIDEATYRVRLVKLGVDPDTILVPPPPLDLAALRKRLNRLDDPQIEALAIERFPEIKGKFSEGMRRDAKINLLLDHCRRHPEAVSVLEHWLNVQPATCNLEQVEPCYLTHVIENNSRLQLQGIRSASGLVSIALEEIYVTLTATVRQTAREEEAWVAEMAKLAPGEAKRQPSVYGGARGVAARACSR